jgi:hypothetical protein
MPYQSDALRSIRTFPQLIKFLRDELEWPIESDDFQELTFDYTAEELGIDSASAAKIQEIKRLRPLSAGQPWGIFFVKFEPKRLPVVALRRVLSRVVLKKRASANSADRAAWQVDDLLFISNYGEGTERQISFAHFSQDGEKADLPTLKVLGWDNRDTPLHLEDVADALHQRLIWPEDDKNAKRWREQWRSAFTLRHLEVINTSKDLAMRLADLARAIRDRIQTVLAIETEKGPLTKLMRAFQEALIHDLSADDFADMYAQTIAYGLLSARVANPAHDTADAVATHIPVTNPFLKELMETFLHLGGRKRAERGGNGIDFDELGVSEVVDLLDAANMEAVVRDFGDRNRHEDPVIHFYELFLKEYDAKKRVERGVFYTPQPVVSYIVRSVHELLQSEFGLEDGLASTVTWGELAAQHNVLTIPEGVDPADPFVVILDPAVGTATFLVEVIDVIHGTLMAKWKQQRLSNSQQHVAWNDYVPKHLLPRLYGFELMMAPYAIAHMKIGLKLYETGYRFGSDERARIYLTNTLEPATDSKKQMAFKEWIPALAHEALAVNAVKRQTRFSVIIGNPPYLREKERGPGERTDRIGGWVRFGHNVGDHALFDDFLKPLSERNLGVHAKLAYELSVMFWRMVLWMAFEKHEGPGIVGMISPRTYISSPGHAGMRQWLRNETRHVWVTDLGGDNRGARKSENIFQIETGVAITLCTNDFGKRTKPCRVRYVEVTGSSEKKLDTLKEYTQSGLSGWKDCPLRGDVFFPDTASEYGSWPRLTDLLPWQHSGCQFKRLWPISESRQVLEQRWRRLISLPRDARASAFVETDARVVAAGDRGSPTLRSTGIVDLSPDAPMPRLERYRYRTLDRQWAFIDARLADRLRPDLVAVLSPNQVFAATLMSKQLGKGPAVSVSSELPDMDVFCNRGAKDVIPLWRDGAATEPNVTQGVLTLLRKRIGVHISPEELYCYCIAVLASPAYAELFEKELATPGPRIPLTQDASLFGAGVSFGARFIWLQTYGRRWLIPSLPQPVSLVGVATLSRPISERATEYPRHFAYDSTSRCLVVGNGVISNVDPQVYAFSVSGFSVVESWLRYRMKERGGRAGRAATRSELDQIRPTSWSFTQELLDLLWVIEGCVGMWPHLAEFLESVTAGDLVLAEELPIPDDTERKAPPAPTEETSARLF